MNITRYLAEMGFMGLLVPEEYGGAGGSMVDLAILCEEMGRVRCFHPPDPCFRLLPGYRASGQPKIRKKNICPIWHPAK